MRALSPSPSDPSSDLAPRSRSPMSMDNAFNLIDFDEPHDQSAPSDVVGNAIVSPALPAASASWAGSQEVKPPVAVPSLANHDMSHLPTSLTRPAPSVAASQPSSLASQQRREKVISRFNEESARRRQEFEDAERRRWEAESAMLRAKDEASHLGGDLEWAAEEPVTDDDAGRDLARRIQELQLQLEDHRRAADFREQLSHAPVARAPVISAPAVSAPAVAFEPAGEFIDLGSRYKPKAPAAWTGVYDHHKLETWIASAEAWLGSIGLTLSKPIDREKTPTAFYAVRNLLSDVEPSGGISPVAWFDARQRRKPFGSAAEFFAAIREHWVDDQAKERSFRKYRTLKQGNMTARDYATQLAALADACLTHEIPDAERILVFLDGLHSDVANFVRQNLGILELQGVMKPNFEQVARLAAMTDTMPQYRASRSARPTSGSATTSSSASKRTNGDGTNSSSRKESDSPGSLHAAWRERATKWQSEHPTSAKSVWHKPDSNPPRSNLRCFNCGKNDNHFSVACPNARVSPAVVVAAAKLSSGNAMATRSGAAAAASKPVKDEPMTVASATIVELDDEEQGKARDE